MEIGRVTLEGTESDFRLGPRARSKVSFACINGVKFIEL